MAKRKRKAGTKITYTTRELFDELEQLRVKTKVPVEDIVDILGISKVTYYRWKQDENSIPKIEFEPHFRALIEMLKYGLRNRVLPVSASFGELTRYRRQVLSGLVGSVTPPHLKLNKNLV